MTENTTWTAPAEPAAAPAAVQADPFGPPPAAPAAPSTAGRTRRLTRRREGRMLAGVCTGLADHLGVDVTVMRLLFVAAAVFGGGAGIVLYLAGWVLMPKG